MRSLALVLLGLGAAAAAHTAEITLSLTPQTLEYWKILGALPSEVASEPLTLPGGAQVSRSFSADSLALALDSRPVFALEPENWPVVELGSAALVFAREGDTGFLILAGEAGEAVLHPVTVTLGADGRSQEPVEAVLFQEGKTVSLLWSGQRIELPGASNDSLSVVVSTGATQPWEFTRLAVTLKIADEDIPPALWREVSQRSGGEPERKTAGSSRGTGSEANASGADHEMDRGSSASPAIPADYRPLEIYTPPVVRAQLVRQIEAAAQALRNK